MTDVADHGPVQSCGHSVYRVAKISGVGLVCLDCGEWEEVPELTASLTSMFRRKDRPVTDLAEFLLARIAEDEAWVAANAWPDQTRVEHSPIKPARVLAECEAKRRLIEIDGRQAKDKGILAALALPYVSHPDYREEWRP